MANEISTNRMVQRIAWDVVETFIRDWQAAPFTWCTEADVQAELVTRLRNIYSWMGLGTVEGRYEMKLPEGWVSAEQKWNRVASQPRVLIGDRKLAPDVVVYADLPKSERRAAPAEAEWPILWACELKFPWLKDKSRVASDEQKLEVLAKHATGFEGCCIEFALREPDADDGFEYKDGLAWKPVGDRVWTYRARLPMRRDGETES